MRFEHQHEPVVDLDQKREPRKEDEQGGDGAAASELDPSFAAHVWGAPARAPGTADGAAVSRGADAELMKPHTGSIQEHAQWVTAGESAARELDEIELTLVPAYRAAVDALDAEGAAEIAGAILSVIRAVDRVAEQVEVMAKAPPSLSAAGDGVDANPVQGTLEHVRLLTIHQMLSGRRTELTQLLSRSVGPTQFRGALVLPGAQQVPLGTSPLVALQAEASNVVALVSTLQTILGLVPGAAPGVCPPVSKSTQLVIAHELAPWRGRPVNFAFLRHVLMMYGIWDQLDQAREILGMSVAEMEAQVDERPREEAFLDVGTFDEKEVADLLDPGRFGDVPENHPSGLKSRVTTAKAKNVAAQLMSASPEGRAHLVIQLHEQGQLDIFGRKLPWTMVEHIAHSIRNSRNGPEAERALELLAPYYVGHGGEGRLSPKEAMLEREAANARDGDWLGEMTAKVVRHGANLVTAGGYNEASDAYAAHRDGLISNEEYDELWSGAVGKSALSLGGGALGYGLGAAAGRQLALRFGLPTVLGEGVLGGAASGLGGHLAGDVTAQSLGQKDGFDSAEDYVLSAGLGGAIGGATAGLSMAASRFLPPGSGSAAHDLAARHPAAAPLLDRLRATPGGRAKIRVLVDELLNGDQWDLWPPGSGSTAVATAEASAGVRFRPHDELWVDLEVDPRLNAPLGPSTRPERPVTILHAERLPDGDNLSAKRADGPPNADGMVPEAEGRTGRGGHSGQHRSPPDGPEPSALQHSGLDADALGRFATLKPEMQRKFSGLDLSTLRRFASLEPEALQKFGSLRHADVLTKFGACDEEGLAKLAQLDRSALERFGGWDPGVVKNISRLEIEDIHRIAQLKVAPGQAVENALADFGSEQFRFGSEVFQLDRKGMSHILERHHPQYWDGTVKVPQSFFEPRMSLDEVQDAIRAVMQQNRDTLIRRGTTSMYQINGTYGGRTYVLGINNGRVGQFYPP